MASSQFALCNSVSTSSPVPQRAEPHAHPGVLRRRFDPPLVLVRIVESTVEGGGPQQRGRPFRVFE
jgi:hypothetical protein